MNKKIIIPLALAAVMTFSTACSAKESASSYDGFYAETTANAMYDNGYDMGNAMAAGGVEEVYYDGKTTGEALPTSGEIEIDTASEKLIIRNAELGIETSDLEATYNALINKLNDLGGSVFSVYKQNNDFSASASAVFTIPPQNLDAFLAQAAVIVAETGKITDQTVTSEDITGSYVDTEVRLENKRRNLEKYYEYLADADTLDEMIMIQNQIDSITADIESYETMLKLWNANLAESRINISIRQPQDPNAIEIEDVTFSTLSFENMGKLMSNGIKKCVDVIGTLAQWFVIVVFTLLPVIAVAGVVVIIAVLRSRSLDKKYPERVEAREAQKARRIAAKHYYKNRTTPTSTDKSNETDESATTGYRKPPENE